MGPASAPTRRIRFGAFEVDVKAGELLSKGLKIRLQEKPFQILLLLLEEPGEVLAREEIRRRLWSDDTFVDFEHSINTAVKRLREALSDSADHPRFIETVGRRGYRFIAPVEAEVPTGAGPDETTGHNPRPGVHRAVARRPIALLASGILAVAIGLFALNVAGLRHGLLRAIGVIHASPAPIRSIAVLPLENLSGDPKQEYFADGMTDELITTLGRISALRVISRTSVMRYKRTQKPLPEIAHELNVDAIIEGSVVRSGNRVRITANLVQAPGERHLWAESYERDLGDVLSLQDEVARDVAGKIQVKLTPPERARLAGAGPVNPQAYDAYLKGQLYLQRESGVKDRFNKAIHFFQEATRLDPNFALAHAGLAKSYLLLGDWDLLPPGEVFPKARAAALRAVEIDGTVADGHIALGWVKIFYDWDWSGAEHEFRQAITLSPNNANAHEGLGGYFVVAGRYSEAEKEFKREFELDPLSIARRPDLGDCSLAEHRYDEAIEREQAVLDVDPNNARALIYLAEAHVRKGSFENAIKEMEKAVTISGDKVAIGLVGYADAAAGRRQRARKILAHMKNLSKSMYVSPFEFSIVYAGLGDKEETLRWLERGVEEHDHDMAFVRRWTMYDGLRSDPRFQALLRRMNFPQ